MKNKYLIAALIFPIIVLGAVTINKYMKVSFGDEYVIPIEGFDPRDILSGHYLIYRIDYGPEAECRNRDYDSDVYMCLKKQSGEYSSEIYHGNLPDRNECLAIIKGSCVDGRFEAGIERFYIPEEHAPVLDRVVRDGKGKVVIAVNKNGEAVVKDLLINDKSWQDYIDR